MNAGGSSIPFLSWGDAFIDYEDDGCQDLFIVNGHVFPVADKSDWGSTYAQKPLLFRNVKNGHFEPVPAVKGTGLAVVLSARGAAFGDLFNDGKTDVVMNPIDGPPVLLRNVNDDHNHWVELKLTGDQRSPHDAVGAFAILTINGEKWRRDVLSSGSYISSNDQRMLFGLGSAEDAGSVEIHWPSGSKETVRLPAVDRIYSITEGKGITGSLSGGEPCKEVPPARSQPITQRKSLRH